MSRGTSKRSGEPVPRRAGKGDGTPRRRGSPTLAERLRVAEARLEELDRVKGELEIANARFKHADRLKTEFLASVSHELRTPLTSIRSFAEILGRYDDQEPAERRRYVGIITAETDRLTNLINDLLDLTKIEAGRAEWRMRLLELLPVALSSAELLRPQANERGVDLTVSLSEHLPLVLGDEDRLKQVLTNLLANAVKFTDRGGAVRLSAELMKGDAGVRVEVSDTGIGITEEQLPLIFDKFVQIKHPRRASQGTGLGLPIVREIVEAHGGTIHVASRPGEGSSFTVELPTVTGKSQFQAYLDWRVGYSERRGEPFTLIVIGPGEREEHAPGRGGLHDRVHAMVRSSDAVLDHDRAGWVAVFAPVKRVEAQALLNRFREQLGAVRSWTLFTVSFPDDARSAKALAQAVELGLRGA